MVAGGQPHDAVTGEVLVVLNIRPAGAAPVRTRCRLRNASEHQGVHRLVDTRPQRHARPAVAVIGDAQRADIAQGATCILDVQCCARGHIDVGGTAQASAARKAQRSRAGNCVTGERVRGGDVHRSGATLDEVSGALQRAGDRERMAVTVERHGIGA